MNKISLLVANYNNGRYFKDCYDSIVSQTYENWEVIIVDDASTDNSVDIIKKLIAG
ncbi:glycosyltransferase [uncultured Chryseobacterium sp.]|uniref:glycosyltransferase family 2 protein n=1 Tax=uncultured Chryseobacterium sp. TaxID=259322 RepID=UPI0025CEDC9C|nr:glycosyltransferase [uncultured Chryseobacterium sp.]